MEFRAGRHCLSASHHRKLPGIKPERPIARALRLCRTARPAGLSLYALSPPCHGSAPHDCSPLFDRLVDAVSDVLPDFGARLAVDSKALPSWASHPAHDSTPDGRRDWNADYGKKDYRGQRDDGSIWSKVTRWFGYKLHLIVDATYELPVAWTVTKASTADVTEAAPLLQPRQTRHPLILQFAKFFAGDRGYDDTKLVTLCWDTYPVKPVIDIRNMWKDPDATRTLPGQTTVTDNYRGAVFCHDPVTGAIHTMSNGGFEEARHTLKKRCPARFAGISCAGQDQCLVAPGLRILLETDRRVFTPPRPGQR